MEEGEKVEDTAIRETLEETGYSIKFKDKIEQSPYGNTNFSLVYSEIDTSQNNLNFDNPETIGFLWIKNPKIIPLQNWRFPEQREWIIELFDKYSTRYLIEIKEWKKSKTLSFNELMEKEEGVDDTLLALSKK
ncbi:NUDIX hydrolase [Persicobacter diffluens]|nr:hypothetical protein PEDI_51390 [Persicobacter diffluens]